MSMNSKRKAIFNSTHMNKALFIWCSERAATALLGRGGSAEKCRRLGERKDPREQGFDHRSPFRIRCESGGVVFKTLFAGIFEVFCNTP